MKQPYLKYTNDKMRGKNISTILKWDSCYEFKRIQKIGLLCILCQRGVYIYLVSKKKKSFIMGVVVV